MMILGEKRGVKERSENVSSPHPACGSWVGGGGSTCLWELEFREQGSLPPPVPGRTPTTRGSAFPPPTGLLPTAPGPAPMRKEDTSSRRIHGRILPKDMPAARSLFPLGSSTSELRLLLLREGLCQTLSQKPWRNPCLPSRGWLPTKDQG